MENLSLCKKQTSFQGLLLLWSWIPKCVMLFSLVPADLCFLLQKCNVVETSHSHPVIGGTRIGITLKDLSVLWVFNTEIFTVICLRIFLLAKTFIPFPSGFEEHFTWNLLPAFTGVLLALYIIFKHQKNDNYIVANA